MEQVILPHLFESRLPVRRALGGFHGFFFNWSEIYIAHGFNRGWDNGIAHSAKLN
tara:strand:+ start:275 stop:439 length:165 start_codon:yes stop_codon:yes gene_type:complete